MYQSRNVSRPARKRLRGRSLIVIDGAEAAEKARKKGFGPAAVGAVVRFAKACSGFAAFLIAMAPVHALAQDDERNVGVQERARPEYDPLGLRFGGFDVNAQVEVTAEHVDNLFATEADSDGDMIYSVAPEATLTSHWSRHAININVGGSTNKHNDFGTEDASTLHGSVYGRLDVGDDTQLSGGLGAAHEVEPRTDPAALAILTGPVEYDRTNAYVSAQHTINRFRFQLSASTAKYDFQDVGLVDQDFRDHTESSVTGRVEVAVSPRVALVGQVIGDKRDYDNLSSLSSDGKTFLAGVRLDLTNLVRGEFSVGRFSQDYDSGSVDGTALDGNLEWFVTGLTTVTFRAHRDVQESAASTQTPFIDTSAGVRIDHELLRNLILSGDFGYEKRKYEPPVVREDQLGYATLDLKYLLNRRVALHASYGHQRNDSSGTPDPHHDFDVNRILVGLVLRL